jgi:hypothetical protein
MSTAADECVTRENLPFSEEYPREIEVNTAYVPYRNILEKGGFMLPLKEGLAAYQLVGEVMAHQGYDG